MKNLEKIVLKNKILILILLLASLVYQLTLSKGIYLMDTAQFISSLNTTFDVKDTYIFSSSPLYALVTSLLFEIMPVENILNWFSFVMILGSLIFFWLLVKKIFNEMVAISLSLIYIFLPFIWFHAINAEVYATILFVVNLWAYLLFSLEPNVKNQFILGMFLGVAAFVHLSILLLTPLFVYMFKKLNKLLSVLSPIIVYFFIKLLCTFTVIPYLTVSFMNSSWIVATFLLTIWELFNTFTLVPFSLLTLGFYYVIKEKKHRFLIWVLPFTIAILPAGKDVIVALTASIPALVIMMGLVLEKIKSTKVLIFLLALSLTTMIIKFLPLAIVLHNYKSPHEQYAKFVIEHTKPDDVILSGHDCAWLYGKRTCITAGKIDTSNLSSKYVFTSHFFMNENRFELLQFKMLFSKSLIKEYNYTVREQDLCKIAEYKHEHNYEDPYWYFYGVSPSILERLIFLGKPAYNESYKIYRLC